MKDAVILILLILALILLFEWLKLKRLHKSAPVVTDEAPSPPQERSPDRVIERLLNAFPGPFFSINAEGKFIRTNLAAQNIFTERNLQGRSIQSIFLEAPLIEKIQEALKSWEPNSTVIQLPANSPFSQSALGKDSHWEIDLSPISLRSNTQELQIIMREITTSIHTEQVRQDFVANASHELRTPLSIISGYLENLTEDNALEDPEMSKKMLHTMVRHVNRINRIVEDMLVISKLESEDGMPLNIEDFAIGPCVRDVVERLEPLINSQQAKLTIDIPEIPLAGDRFYWTQILFNLVENALKQNASTPVHIQIIGKLIGSDRFELQIKDDGIGIPSADLPFIFKRFFRVEKHHSQSQVKGTGLGLSIVKRAVEAHQGNITASSTPGVETSFTIIVPVR